MAGLSNWKGNLKRAITGNELKEDLVAGIGAAAPYVLVPTLFGMSEWTGLLVGTGSSWLLGAITGNYRIKSAAIAIAMAHILFSFFKEDIASVVGNPPWNFSEAGMQGLAESDYQFYRMGNGEIVRGIPASTMSDHTYASESLMDYDSDSMEEMDVPGIYSALPGDVMHAI